MAVMILGTVMSSSQGSGDGIGKMFADMGTHAGVVKLFKDANVILPAWVHYLAFDLLVGNMLVEKNLA